MSKKIRWLCIPVIALVALIAFQPAFKIGFYDGWWYLEWAATMNLPRYLIQFFDPANITQGYRPVQGLYIYLIYNLFHFNPDAYHGAQTLLHAANASLLFLIVGRLGKNWRVALIAALFYATSFVFSMAVFWHAVVDPLSGFFYLLTMLLWIEYQTSGRRWHWALTFGAYLLALLSKEIAIFLPAILFLIARWFFGKKFNFSTDLPQYAPFVLAWIPYLYLVIQVQSHGEFTGQFGFRIGPHMLINLMPYLAVLAFPWTAELPIHWIYYLWLAIAIVIYLGIMIYKKNNALLLLALVAVLNILPLTGFPLDYFDTRYLYLSLTASAILLALLVNAAMGAFGARRLVGADAALVIALLIVGNGSRVAESAAGLAEYTRQLRVPFRDIAIQHPAFPENTLLYFIYSPKTPLIDLQGLFLTRYGTGLKVSGTEDAVPTRLRDYAHAYVYYFDDQVRPRELTVARSDAFRATPAPPLYFNAPIRLESFDLVASNVKRNTPMVLFFNWRALGNVDKPYTVFVHLIDSQGHQVAQSDSAPQKGMSPTTTWKLNQLIVDAIVLPIPPDVPSGDNYRVELGLYYPPTMERLSVIDANGNPIADKIVIEPFSISD